MKNFYLSTLFLLLSLHLTAQEIFPLREVCAPFGTGFIEDLIDEELIDSRFFEVDIYDNQCVRTDAKGQLYFQAGSREEFCCGTSTRFELTIYSVDPETMERGEPMGYQPVELTIKCPKPDCGLVALNLTDDQELVDTNGDGEPDAVPCLTACENSTTTYIFDPTGGLNYNWSAGNGTSIYSAGSPGEVAVEWGSQAAAFLTVTATDALGNPAFTRTWCVDLNETPVADFSASSVACLGQPVHFTNNTSGPPATFAWNFGDGTTQQGAEDPKHEYNSPGTYTVTLYATSQNSNTDGTAGCCCTDSISYDIIIDPLPGPQIFWISTLCEGDTSRYWTDAANCSDYDWNVSTNGDIIAGTGSDTITVVWAEGPSGQVNLLATGCDATYCTEPTQVVVPIISSNGAISGPTEVCAGATAQYSLPKWMTVEYKWETDLGGTIIGVGDGHTVSVAWPDTPGTYELDAQYGSYFLNGLPNHGGDDCSGTAGISVTVLGDFSLSTNQPRACVGETTLIQATSNIEPFPVFDWSVAGQPGLNSTGTSFYATWPGPGTYLITATASNAGDYCVAERTISVFVGEAVIPNISGPDEYCAGSPTVFTVDNPIPGYAYTWSVAGGAVVNGQGSPTATVEFSSLSGATVSVVGEDTNAPFCTSEPATLSLGTIGFVGDPQITGPGACTSESQTYGIDVPQVPEADYTWSISPVGAGSIVSGANAPSCMIQWNAAAGAVNVELSIVVCGQELTRIATYQLSDALEPTLTQTMDLCGSTPATLTATGGPFSSITWSTGVSGATTAVTAPGNYQVTTIDTDGCSGFADIQVSSTAGPLAGITSSGDLSVCVNNFPVAAPNPVLSAITDTGVDFEWFCNGISQGAPSPTATFTHVWNTMFQTFDYYVIVRDGNGCDARSETIRVLQRDCTSTGGNGCDREDASTLHLLTAGPESPYCDTVNLTATFSADSVEVQQFTGFGDYTVLSGSGDETTGSTGLRVRINEVGCVDFESFIGNYNYDFDTVQVSDGTTGVLRDSIFVVDSFACGYTELVSVCNPLLADFAYEEICGEVSFSDRSLTAPDLLSGPLSYSWDFGDAGMGSGPSPVHLYGQNDTYTVVLTVSDGVCESRYEETIIIDQLANIDFIVAPGTVCAGEVVNFTPSGAGLVDWTWDFGDTTQLEAELGVKAFLTDVTRNYTVTLVAQNNSGCVDTATNIVTVNPTPDVEAISATNGLILCEGSSTVLSVTNVPGYTYAWSTGEMTSSISVSAPGVYDVTLTNADNCSTVLPSVEVQVIPLPDSSFIGNLFICGTDGSTTLSASAGGGHTFSWTNLTTLATDSGPNFTVAYAGTGTQTVELTVTSDAYLCEATSRITIIESIIPDAALSVSGSGCAGDVNVISVINPSPDVAYLWSTGEQGPTISTTLSGSYTLVATHKVSGCRATSSVTINPLPDICLVPTGCYETCLPDTLYAPLGAFNYAWTKDGALVGTDHFLIVNSSGEYQVYVEDTTTNCGIDSEPLYLEVIDCSDPIPTDCDELTTLVSPFPQGGEAGSCCYEFVYDALPDNVYYIEISSTDANLALVPGTINPAFGYAQVAPGGTIQLAADDLLSAPLPADLGGAAGLAFCPNDATESPQVILIQYFDEEGNVVCSEELSTDCQVEPDCAYVTSDTLTCTDDKLVQLTVEVCVPEDSDYPVAFLQFLAQSPAAETLLPYSLDIAPAIAPGECRTIALPGTSLNPGDEFCYQVVAHSANPDKDPAALCCSTSEIRCLVAPDCDPCDDLSVEVAERPEDGCCYDIFLFDGTPDFSFDDVQLCLVDASEGATLTTFNMLGSGLMATTNGRTVTVSSTDGGVLPDGFFQLPSICLEGSDLPFTQLEIKWRKDGEVVCRDTTSLFCEPECGYLEPQEVVCEGDVYLWTGLIVNTSDHLMSEAFIDFPSPLDGYDTTISFAPLSPGASTTLSFEIGNPAGPNDTICVSIVLHETGADELHLNCCSFEACLVMADCPIKNCVCPDLLADIRKGFTVERQGPSFDYTFTGLGDYGPCDEVTWEVRSRSPLGPYFTVGKGNPFSYTFPSASLYQVRMNVTRYDNQGKICDRRSATRLIRVSEVLSGTKSIRAFPNPAGEEVYVEGLQVDDRSQLALYSATGRLVRRYGVDERPFRGDVIALNLKGLTSGVYILRGMRDGAAWAERIVVR